MIATHSRLFLMYVFVHLAVTVSSFVSGSSAKNKERCIQCLHIAHSDENGLAERAIPPIFVFSAALCSSRTIKTG